MPKKTYVAYSWNDPEEAPVHIIAESYNEAVEDAKELQQMLFWYKYDEVDNELTNGVPIGILDHV